MKTPEEFAKEHFAGIEKETWYPAFIGLMAGYREYVLNNLPPREFTQKERVQITRLAQECDVTLEPQPLIDYFNSKQAPQPDIAKCDHPNDMRFVSRDMEFCKKCGDRVKTKNFFDDIEKWENSFYCNECGCDKITDFVYDRTCSNCEVWHCKHCNTETTVGFKPNEDNY